MAKYVVEHDREKCIGCGACVAINPDDWTMDGDKSRLVGGKAGKVESKEIDEKAFKRNNEVADSCPVQCISVKKK